MRTGGILSLWQPAHMPVWSSIDDLGALCSHELATDDVDPAKSFYGELLGWEYQALPSRHTTITNGGRRIGTMRERASHEQGATPPAGSPTSASGALGKPSGKPGRTEANPRRSDRSDRAGRAPRRPAGRDVRAPRANRRVVIRRSQTRRAAPHATPNLLQRHRGDDPSIKSRHSGKRDEGGRARGGLR
jgi:hypothetical protein